MDIFTSVKEHPIWGWLSEYPSPWEIIEPSTKNSLRNIIINLAEGKQTKKIDYVVIDDKNGPVFIHEAARIGPFVKIEGPAYIEAGSEIKHSAYIRPGAYISKGCVVGHSSEIKNTLMMPNSKIPHFNYVGDSILGHSCNLGAGTKIANTRLDRSPILVRLPNGITINTKMRKLGALIGDKSSLGCNVVTNPGAVISPGSAIPPNMTISGCWK